MKFDILKTEKRLCTCCMENHEVKTIRMNESLTFKGVPVTFKACSFYCDASDSFYYSEDMLRDNDIAMKDAYRKKNKLLSSSDIRAIRNKYGISQRDLACILGWGPKTITRYESHQVQDKAHDSILKKIDSDPEWFRELLINMKDTVSNDAFNKYYLNATELYEHRQDDYLRKSIESIYAKFNGLNNINGFSDLSLNKVVDAIRYFASAGVECLYKVKLMKMLWYADMLAYKEHGHAITGLVYQALPMGAVPVKHEAIIELKNVPCEQKIIDSHIAYYFNLDNRDKRTTLSDEDKRILDCVIFKFSKMKKDDIVAYMHEEQAYINTKQFDYISFEYADALRI